jgi:hypothetical protein
MHVASYKVWGNGDSVKHLPDYHKRSTPNGDNPPCYSQPSLALEVITEIYKLLLNISEERNVKMC